MVVKLQSRDIRAMMTDGIDLGGFIQVPLDKNLTHFCYNGLDSAVTLRVHNALAPRLASNPHAALSYSFVRAMQGPALAMVNTGIAVNQKVRQDETTRIGAIKAEAQRRLDLLADAIWGPEHYTERTKTKEWHTPLGARGQLLAPRERTITTDTERTRPRGLNAASSKQALAFFNIALGCEVQYEVRKTPAGTIRTPSANDKALKRWAARMSKGPGVNPRDKTVPNVRFAAPFVSLILTIRDCDKKLEVLKAPLDPDGRMRCSYNVVGAETGRWSSSKNAFGRGQNMQNIAPEMRRMFCADDGQRFCSTDLEQAESRLVGALVWQATGDSTYWDACESADLHTTVAQMCWQELKWSADPKENRVIADTVCPDLPRFTFRDVSKREGHATNYYGTAYGVAAQIGIPVQLVEDFQRRYFHAFPAIREWHKWTRQMLVQNQYLDTPLGRRRWFFGRLTEESTLREAIAHVPQSTIGELLNLALYNTWSRSILPPTNPQYLPLTILLQNHDAFAFQTPLSTDLPALLAAVKAELEIPIPITRPGHPTRFLTIPGEFVTGFNWAYEDPERKIFTDGNPDGLRKWRGADPRRRVQSARPAPGDWLNRTLP